MSLETQHDTQSTAYGTSLTVVVRLRVLSDMSLVELTVVVRLMALSHMSLVELQVPRSRLAGRLRTRTRL